MAMASLLGSRGGPRQPRPEFLSEAGSLPSRAATALPRSPGSASGLGRSRSAASAGAGSSSPARSAPWAGVLEAEENEARLQELRRGRPSPSSQAAARLFGATLGGAPNSTPAPTSLSLFEASGTYGATASCGGARSSTAAAAFGGGGEGDEVCLEDLGRSLADVERLLQEVTKGRSKVENAVDPAEEEEERRRLREEEKKRILQARQAARDPSANMAARLELAREAVDGPKVPMRPMEFNSLAKGRELIPLVDVKRIQGECMSLEHGTTAASLLEFALMKERFARLCAPRLGSTSHSGLSTLGMGSTRLQSSRSAPGLGLSPTQERVLAARARGKAEHFDKSLKRLYTMRSETPHEALLRFEAMAHRMALASNARSAAEEDRSLWNASMISNVSQVATTSEHIRGRVDGLVAKEQNSAAASFSRSSGRRFFLATCLSLDGCDIATGIAQQVHCLAPKREDGKDDDLIELLTKHSKEPSAVGMGPKKSAGGKAPKKKTRFELVLEKKAFAKRIRDLRRKVIGIVRFLVIFFSQRKKRMSAVCIAEFMKQLINADRMKFSIRLMVNKIKLLTRVCKKHAQKKMRRILEMQQVKHLKAYFQVYALEMMELKAISGSESKEVITQALNWKRMRIPEKESLDVLRRFYQAALMRKMRARRSFAATIEQVTEEHKEFKQFHGIEDRTRRQGIRHIQRKASKSIPFWRLSEDTVLDLITFSASVLRGVEPFCHHPALLISSPPALGASSEVTHRGETLKLSAAIRGRISCGELKQGFLSSLMLPRHTTVRHDKLQPQAQAPAQVRRRTVEECKAMQAKATAEWNKAAGCAKNLEELLECFTPRLCLPSERDAVDDDCEVQDEDSSEVDDD
mmetsp:Transcript_44335/g.142000  ORF Transcript_44335/g.142000 Transcript_44335/m.142000 type:complete len:864 (-) Transcript_44335:144-2735(-)